MEADLDIAAYFCRAPSHSNLGEEAPLRFDFGLCESLGSMRSVCGGVECAVCVEVWSVCGVECVPGRLCWSLCWGDG